MCTHTPRLLPCAHAQNPARAALPCRTFSITTVLFAQVCSRSVTGAESADDAKAKACVRLGGRRRKVGTEQVLCRCRVLQRRWRQGKGTRHSWRGVHAAAMTPGARDACCLLLLLLLLQDCVRFNAGTPCRRLVVPSPPLIPCDRECSHARCFCCLLSRLHARPQPRHCLPRASSAAAILTSSCIPHALPSTLPPALARAPRYWLSSHPAHVRVVSRRKRIRRAHAHQQPAVLRQHWRPHLQGAAAFILTPPGLATTQPLHSLARFICLPFCARRMS